MKKDKHGIPMYNYVSHAGNTGEIVIVRFEKHKFEKEQFPILYAHYIQQADELINHSLFIQKIGGNRWTREASLILGKAAYALRQAHQVEFWITKENR